MKNSEKFFSMLKWAVERKDFEDFWPVGLESTGPRYWPQLVVDLESLLLCNGKLNKPDYPTSNVALAFCLIYGLRELGLSSNRCINLFEAVFEAAQAQKKGDLFNSSGSNLLWDSTTLIQKFNNGTPIIDTGMTVQDIYELSGQILALAESEYFMNHRIATEKHGPYVDVDGDIFVVRSVKNLSPIDLWPELRSINLNNDEFHLIFKYHQHEVSFDVLSNLLTPLPPKEALVSMVIVDNKNNVWDYFRIKELTTSVRQGIYIIGNSLQKMTQQEKSERMTEILYFGCRNNFGFWKDKARYAIETGRNRKIQHPVPKFGEERLKYYDLMQEMELSYREKL